MNDFPVPITELAVEIFQIFLWNGSCCHAFNHTECVFSEESKNHKVVTTEKQLVAKKT